MLKDNALLNYDPTSRKYAITTKGLKYIDLYNKMDKMLQY
jgi:predicted transcriptional regulator